MYMNIEYLRVKFSSMNFAETENNIMVTDASVERYMRCDATKITGKYTKHCHIHLAE